tara:strand:+ start:2532 stop:2918 length:387 start_codon:yes stop_codon:yes gene_type:complete
MNVVMNEKGELIFTQEVKDAWIKALKGEYYKKKGTGTLRQSYANGDKFCCIGVLCDIVPELGIDKAGGTLRNGDSYFSFGTETLNKPLGIAPNVVDDLVGMNDSTHGTDSDFENMIPLIEELEVTIVV